MPLGATGAGVHFRKRFLSLFSWRKIWATALTTLGLLGQLLHWGWLSLDVFGRLDIGWRVVETMGGSPALAASIISSWPFSLALMVGGLAYLIFVGEPKAGVQRHPALPYLAAAVLFICVAGIISVAVYGWFEVQQRKAYAEGASGIPRDSSPTNPQAPSNQRPLYAAGGNRQLTLDQQRILIAAGSKMYSELGTILITYFTTDGETSNYAQTLYSTFARAAIKVGISSQALGDPGNEGNLIEVANKDSPPPEAIKLQELLFLAEIQTTFVNNVVIDPKSVPVVLFIGPRPIQR